MALSAFDSFCRGLKRGRFPDLQDRDNLWKLLVVLTARKACHLIRDERRLKRGGGQTAGSDRELDQLASEEPSPEFAAELAENCQRLLDILGDAELRAIALSKMEGCTTEEIAGQLDCAPRTVGAPIPDGTYGQRAESGTKHPKELSGRFSAPAPDYRPACSQTY